MEQESAVDSQGFEAADLVAPAAQDGVAHVDDGTTWTAAILASLRSSDRHVSDDEIFRILMAGGDGQTAGDLCAARNVTIPMYCVWKAKYRGLSVEAIGKARRRELWRARVLVGAFLAASVIGVGLVLFGLVRAAQATTTVTAGLSPAALPVAPMNPEPLDSGNVRATSSATEPVTQTGAEPPASADRQPNTVVAPAPPTTAPRYDVQVTAAATLEEGRVLVDRLAAAGHPAYVSAAVVKDVEVFRVRVGPFEALEEAREVSLQLQRNGHPDAWIVR